MYNEIMKNRRQPFMRHILNPDPSSYQQLNGPKISSQTPPAIGRTSGPAQHQQAPAQTLQVPPHYTVTKPLPHSSAAASNNLSATYPSAAKSIVTQELDQLPSPTTP